MKRRNAESGKLRRPLKRTKITEGMYGNSLLYLKFVMLWATVVLADYMLEFRFEFLWPFWMMLRSVYDSFKYQGLAFSVFFICIALTSDMICFFFIPLQYIFFAASTYVWVQYVWYSFAEKGICLPTVVVCCFLVYVEGALRSERTVSMELTRPLAAHCVGYPAVTLGAGVKAHITRRLRLRRQRQVRQENEFYFQLMRDALPESALEQNQPSKDSAPAECAAHAAADARHLNGSLKKRQPNGTADPALHTKLDKLEKPAANGRAHALSNGQAGIDDDHSKGGTKPSKCEKKEASTLKEEKKKSKNKDKDSSDSHKSTEQIKEQIVKEKEVESTKETRSNKECNSNKEKEKALEKEREREIRERDKERERERERERELREAREYAEEIKRLKAELATSRNNEAEARRALAAAAAAERQRRAEHAQLKQQHQALQHKIATWRTHERATLERRLGEERRARTAAEHQLQRAKRQPQHTSNNNNQSGCDNEWCRAAIRCGEAEAAALRRELQRARQHVTDQVLSLSNSSSTSSNNQSGCDNEWCRAAIRCGEAEAAALRRELQRARQHVTDQVLSLSNSNSTSSNNQSGCDNEWCRAAIRCGEAEAAALRRELQRARQHVTDQVLSLSNSNSTSSNNQSGCDNEWCRAAIRCGEAEAAALRRELQRARQHVTDQVLSLSNSSSTSSNNQSGCDNEWCRAAIRCGEAEAAALRRELQRARQHVTDQVLSLSNSNSTSSNNQSGCDNEWCRAAIRCGEAEAAALRRELQRARQHVTDQVLSLSNSNSTSSNNQSGCDNEWCRAAIRCGEAEAAALRRELQRARQHVTDQVLSLSNSSSTSSNNQSGCDNEWCRAAIRCGEADTAALRRELARARQHATDQARALESPSPSAPAPAPAPASAPPEAGARLAAACAALSERSGHLQRALSAETRVKLDLLQALGDAKRHMHIQEGLISRQEKEIEELKAQMLAVMPTEFVSAAGAGVSKLRLTDGSPLDPNASVYTPKQLCSDA